MYMRSNPAKLTIGLEEGLVPLQTNKYIIKSLIRLVEAMTTVNFVLVAISLTYRNGMPWPFLHVYIFQICTECLVSKSQAINQYSMDLRSFFK